MSSSPSGGAVRGFSREDATTKKLADVDARLVEVQSPGCQSLILFIDAFLSSTIQYKLVMLMLIPKQRQRYKSQVVNGP